MSTRSASRRLLLAALVLGSAGFASAQVVSVRGEVEDNGSAFFLSCTPLVVTSSGPILANFVGLDVKMQGHVIGPNLFEAQSAVIVNDVLEASSTAQLGGFLTLEVARAPSQLELIFVSIANGFHTIQKLGFFLDPNQFTLVPQDVMPASSKLQVTLGSPSMRSLANLDVYFQDVKMVSFNNCELGNVDCLTILPWAAGAPGRGRAPGGRRHPCGA